MICFFSLPAQKTPASEVRSRQWKLSLAERRADGRHSARLLSLPTHLKSKPYDSLVSVIRASMKILTDPGQLIIIIITITIIIITTTIIIIITITIIIIIHTLYIRVSQLSAHDLSLLIIPFPCATDWRPLTSSTELYLPSIRFRSVQQLNISIATLGKLQRN